jgi:hypothetical protein
MRRCLAPIRKKAKKSLLFKKNFSLVSKKEIFLEPLTNQEVRVIFVLEIQTKCLNLFGNEKEDEEDIFYLNFCESV